MTEARTETKIQATPYVSPWSIAVRLKIGLWSIVWATLWRLSPNKLCWRWRAVLLRLFGATLHGTPFFANTARVKMPWNLKIGDRASVGPGAEIYNLGPCVIGARACISQYVYLCGGTHDLSLTNLPLVVGRIEIGEQAFIGARVMILPGVTIGEGAVAGAGAVVTKDIPPWTISAGNPAKPIGERARPTPPPDSQRAQ